MATSDGGLATLTSGRRCSFQEVVVSALLFVLVLLWLTRDMGEAGGWGQLLESPYAKDGTTAIAIGLLLFVIPSTLDAFPFGKSHRHSSEEPARRQSRAILTWKEAQQKIPWGVVMLIGGGFALAEGVTGSGLADVIGRFLASTLNELPDWAMMMAIATVTAVLTEVTSNIALLTLFLPIVAKTAVGVGKHPLYFMFPTTLAASFAFMLPVATPPNAIVFSTGVLKVIDMVKAGLVMNIIGIGAVTFAMMTWGSVYFRLDEWNSGVVTNGSVAVSNFTASQP